MQTLKPHLLSLLLLWILHGIGNGDTNSTEASTEKISPTNHFLIEGVLKEIDFNNQSFGEVLVKLNYMFRVELHPNGAPAVLLNIKGLTETQIAWVLNRKITIPKLINVPVKDLLADIASHANASFDRHGDDVFFTPHVPEWVK